MIRRTSKPHARTPVSLEGVHKGLDWGEHRESVHIEQRGSPVQQPPPDSTPPTTFHGTGVQHRPNLRRPVGDILSEPLGLWRNTGRYVETFKEKFLVLYIIILLIYTEIRGVESVETRLFGVLRFCHEP